MTGRGPVEAALANGKTPERVVGGGRFKGSFGLTSASWPLLELVIDDWGLTMRLHGIGKFMARLFVSREQFRTRVVWSIDWRSLDSVDYTDRTVVFRVSGKRVARFVVLDQRRLVSVFRALEAHGIATRRVRQTFLWAGRN